jgi:hypothetical protein
MKFRSFKEKLPVLGSNIVVITHDRSSVGIVEFTPEVRKAIKTPSDEYHSQDYYSDDPKEDGVYDIRCAAYWCYPSELAEM